MTNMGMEGSLAKYRQSVPTRKYYPFLETLAFSSTLSDLFERHLDLGFTNPLRLTQAQLKKAGVPMPSLSSKRAREQRGKIQTNTSKHFFYANKEIAIWKRANPDATKAEVAARQSQLAQQWAILSQQAQAEWLAEHDCDAASRRDCFAASNLDC